MYVIIDNYDSFTHNLYQYLSELSGREVRVVRNDAVTVADIEAMDPEGIIVSPGPGRPEDAGISVDAIRHFAGKVPVLGVCLGHQAIGHAFGGTVTGAANIVHGKAEDVKHDGRGLFRGLQTPCKFARYHSLAIERKSLPGCLEETATSADGEIMGVRHREFVVEGVQFHPESVASDSGKQLLRNFLEYRREPFPFRKTLASLMSRVSLRREEAAAFMEELTSGNLSAAQTAAILVALQVKGVTSEEVAGCAEVLKLKRVTLDGGRGLLDIVGTGGDELGSFNISSFAALLASACGAKVAKHGNRAVSSKSGSADFYQNMGLTIDIDPDSARKLLEETGFTFLFAPVYHGAMKHAAPVRRDLGIKTIMNLLGPVSNPAGADYQLIGVYEESLAPVLAKAAMALGAKKVLVVHSADGMDEISPAAPTFLFSCDEKGEVTRTVFDPASLGIIGCRTEDLAGGSGRDNAVIGKELLEGMGKKAVREAVCLNAGAALALCGAARDMAAGYEMARNALSDGTARKHVAKIADASIRIAKG